MDVPSSLMFFERVEMARRGTRVAVVVAPVDLPGLTTASFPFPFESGTLFDLLLLTALLVTSPKASRFRLPCAASVAPIVLLGPLAETPPFADGGFERVVLVVLALAFSFSLTVMRVARVTRRVC